ncbi:hypothetical protein ACQ86N_47970 [Puia sp. P3]|uniref:hypothetical protein n=1 Tax=Puia sp. P3 TaxID=3423952 RepID=UPI003D66B018
MRENEFDQFFRDRLAGHSSPVPEGMWQRIQGKKDDRKAFIFWWIIGGGLVLATLMAGRFWKAGVHGDGVHGDGVHKNGFSTEKVVKASVDMGAPRTGDDGVNGREDVKGPRTGDDGAGAGKDGQKKGVEEKAGEVVENREVGGGMRGNGRAHSTHALPARIDRKKRLPVRAAELNTKRTPYPKRRPISLDLYVTPLSTRNAGVRVAVPIWKRFSLITGLQYTRINISEGRDSGIHIPSGHFNNIDLPLLVGYSGDLGWGKLGVNAGVIFNLHSAGSDSVSLYRNIPKHSGTSLYFGIDLEKNIGRQWSLFAEPYYRYQLTNRHYLDNGPARDAFGVSLGLRYLLKNNQS